MRNCIPNFWVFFVARGGQQVTFWGHCFKNNWTATSYSWNEFSDERVRTSYKLKTKWQQDNTGQPWLWKSACQLKAVLHTQSPPLPPGLYNTSRAAGVRLSLPLHDYTILAVNVARVLIIRNLSASSRHTGQAVRTLALYFNVLLSGVGQSMLKFTLISAAFSGMYILLWLWYTNLLAKGAVSVVMQAGRAYFLVPKNKEWWNHTDSGFETIEPQFIEMAVSDVHSQVTACLSASQRLVHDNWPKRHQFHYVTRA